MQIQSKLDEIKNADKLLRNATKEYNMVKKKYDRVKDEEYLEKLFTDCEHEKRQVEELEREIKKLNAENKRTEIKLQKRINVHYSEKLRKDDIHHREL